MVAVMKPEELFCQNVYVIKWLITGFPMLSAASMKLALTWSENENGDSGACDFANIKSYTTVGADQLIL